MKYPAQTPIVVRSWGMDASVPRERGGEISVIYLFRNNVNVNIKTKRWEVTGRKRKKGDVHYAGGEEQSFPDPFHGPPSNQHP